MNAKKGTLMTGMFGILMMAACTSDPGTETDRVNDQLQENRKEMSNADDAEEWMEERREATRELAELREKLDNRLIREEKRLADGIKDDKKRMECEHHIEELKMNIARIGASNGLVENSTSETWEKAKADSRRTAEETRNWFERQAEKIDYKTDADADHDGH